MYIDHVGINTNDMEATLQFYCGILGMRLVRTTRTPDGRRHYNVEIGGGNAFAVFDGAQLPTAGERQHVNHLALPVETLVFRLNHTIQQQGAVGWVEHTRNPSERPQEMGFAALNPSYRVTTRLPG